MRTISELLFYCRDYLRDDVEYERQLLANGLYFTTAVASAPSAQYVAKLCDLDDIDAEIIWTAARRLTGAGLAPHT